MGSIQNCDNDGLIHDDSSTSQADEHDAQTDAPGEENCPLGQGLHADSPGVVEKAPAGHMVQVDPDAAEYPAAQAVHTLAPGEENCPLGHGVQALDAASLANEPAGHMEHEDAEAA